MGYAFGETAKKFLQLILRQKIKCIFLGETIKMVRFFQCNYLSIELNQIL